MTTTQQGKLTDEEIEAVWTSLYPLTESNLWADMRDGTHLLKFSRAIEAEVEARTAKKMEALVEALRDLIEAHSYLVNHFAPAGHPEPEAVIRARAALAAHQQDTVAEKGEVKL